MSFPRKKRQGCDAAGEFLQMTAHRRAEICYNTRQTIQDFAFDASFGSGETWKILLREPAKWRMRPYGRIFFRGFSQGFPGPHQNCGKGLRPLSFAAIEARAKGKNGNRSVRKAGSGRPAQKPRSTRGRVSRPACPHGRVALGLLRPLRGSAFGLGQPDRFATGEFRRDRRPPRRPVRIHDNSNHWNGPAFQNHGRGLCPSFLFPQTEQGQKEEEKK